MPVAVETEVPTSKAGPLYPDYLPHYDPLEKVEMVGPFDHKDPGLRADPSKANLFAKATKVTNLSPHCGTELVGVQLTDLTSEGLDELALFVAERGCVVFRDQSFTDSGFERQKEIASHFGPLHVHGWMPHPEKGPAEFVIVYDSKEDLR
jgi:sulfonate dioxygenase